MCYSTDHYKRGESTLSLSTHSSTKSTDDDDECFALIAHITPEASKKSNKSVRFSTLSIVEFGVRIGDSVPCFGPPIGLGEEAIRENVWCVPHFESVRPKRRSLQKLRLDPWERTRLLYRHGFAPEAIEAAACDADTIRTNRKESAMDEEKLIQERPGLLRKGSKKLLRLSNRMRLPRVSRINVLTSRH
ncbi:MAG: hypothetical protein SGBAC_004450 [Bacillariaceae sp.]